MAIPPRAAGGLFARSRDSYFARQIALPAQRFIYTEGASGRLLVLAALIAIAWANSPWVDRYDALWNHHVIIDLGFLDFDESLRHWVNDGLMTVFFFLVTLEVKRELVRGELSDRAKAALPVAAALGGMLLPAAIYLALNVGGDEPNGWGVPVATDIAFALGALAVLGRRAPAGLVTFLLTLAVVDDIGAIVVIGVFYTDAINIEAAAIALGMVVVVLLAQRIGLRAITAYWVIGIALWLAVFESGVHATIAGVLLGALTPARPFLNIHAFPDRARSLLRRIDDALEANDHHDAEAAIGELEALTDDSESPLERLETAIHPWSGLVVLPLFALANAGVSLDLEALRGAAGSAIGQGVFLGLWLGKPLGVVAFSYLAVRLGIARLPDGVRWPQIAAAGAFAGIGFSVSIFITELAFAGEAVREEAKIAIFAATLAAGVLGAALLRLARARSPLASRR